MRIHSRFACLTYHEIGDGSNLYAISESRLRAQLAFLKAAQYAVDDFEEFETRLRLGLKVPTRYIVITVDDGYETSLQAADLLERHGFRATFFLTRERCLKKLGFIRAPDIRALRARGFSAGTHGTTHRALTFLPREQCVAELAESKRWLEDVIGEEVRYMAAPGGFVNARVINLAYECGYTLVGTCNEWMNSPETMALPCTVNRVNIRRHFTLADFRRIVENDFRFCLRRRIRSSLLWLPKQILCR
jgi:peptidoglycan/xylan/chitin deacetylase (PgdA/CDA1 family)